jgi:hypothetical protein
VKKLMSLWRRPTDPETAVLQAEAQRRQACRDMIKISQNIAAKGTSGSLLDAPTPDVLDPGRKDSHNPH